MATLSSRSKSSFPYSSSYSNLSSSNHSRYTTPPASAFASSSTSSFTLRSSTLVAPVKSPARVNSPQLSPSSSVRLSITDRSISPGRSISVRRPAAKVSNAVPSGGHQKIRTCACSPSTHPGSFRCALHKGLSKNQDRHQTAAASCQNSGLNLRRSAMKNSLVRIGGVEGELVKRALTALIRPSSHQQRRRASFKLRPSRLSIMSKVEDS